MRVLVIGAGRVGSKVIAQLRKNPLIQVITVDPRERPHAVEEGLIPQVDHRTELNQASLREAIKLYKPDLVLVTTSAEDIARTGVQGIDVLVDSLRQEIEAASTVPIIAVSRTVA